MTRTRWAVLAVVAALIAAFFATGLNRHFTLDNLRASREAIVAYRDAHPALASAAFFGTYVAFAALSLPAAGILTVAAGAIFGLPWGLALVSFASAIGATLAFLVSRFILHDAIQRRFGDKLKAINAGVRRDGAFYLFTMRLIPAFPFFIINPVMGLTPIRTWTFYWVSQLGMLPLTAIFVYAGRELARIGSPREILSPTLLAALVLIGLFPLIARKILEKINERRQRQQA